MSAVRDARATGLADMGLSFEFERPAEGLRIADIPGRSILGTWIDAVSMRQAVARVLRAARSRSSAVVCVANVHVVMEAYDDAEYRDGVNTADLIVPDGMPLVWLLRQQGFSKQERVAGPDLMPHLCAAAARAGISVGFLGGRDDVLAAAVDRLRAAWPTLKVAFAEAPPFRPLSTAEDRALVQRINASGVGILFVALGCPKQERWMREHRGRVRAVMLGIGAALDFAAGTTPRAPSWMRDRGLEWAFRLMSEPRRLASRYLRHNLRFLWFSRTAMTRSEAAR